MTAGPRIRTVIVDDEPLARRGLVMQAALVPAIEIVGQAGDGPEAVRVITETSPDLVLLDVQIPGFDGFEMQRRLGERVPLIVIVTAFDAHAVRAFDFEVVDYLLKPVADDRFCRAMVRVQERLGARPKSAAIRQLRIPIADRTLLLDLSVVSWIEADDNYAAVHSGGRRYLLREPLDTLEQRLAGDGFLRVHRSALVNLDYVHAVGRGGTSGLLLLRDGSRIPLSRRRRRSVDEAIALRTG